jgi:mRNA interferase MazF
VLDKKLSPAADQAAKRTKRNRSALCATPCGNISVRLELQAGEERDRQGYSRQSQADGEARGWEAEATWLENSPEAGIARGEVRLYKFAAPDKKRPVLVLTRNSAIAYLSTVTVAPLTSTIRGVPSEVVLNEEDGMKSPCAMDLHNAVTVSQQRMGKRVAQLCSARMNEVCSALRFSLGCDAN